jgi:hypothetical protein
VTTATDIHTFQPSLVVEACLRCLRPLADPVHGQRPAPAPVAHARNSDPDTSHAAARSVRHIRESQAEVLALFRAHGPMTDELARTVYRGHQSPSGLRTRRSELVGRGQLVDTGRRVVGATGRRMVVWAAVPEESER